MENETILTPEILVPRLGETLLKMGLLDEQQLDRVLEHQQARAAQGQPLLLGQAAVALGLLDRATLDRAITEQIMLLRHALEEANRGLERRVEARTAELQDALRRLAELNQLKANFVSSISHELRTPLTHLKGYIELLGEGTLGPLTAEQAQALEVCERAGSRLQGLIDDMIMFSLASRGAMTLQLEDLDLGQTAREALLVSRPKADERGVRLETDISTGLPPVRADAQKIGWVIAQLLDNAIKFTSQGGAVRLTMLPGPGTAPIVTISVTDTGVGIPIEQLDEIFEPFHQLDGSTTRQQGGTGLGLALVREIIQAHGSWVQVQSIVHSGTTFSFTLLGVETQSSAR